MGQNPARFLVHPESLKKTQCNQSGTAYYHGQNCLQGLLQKQRNLKKKNKAFKTARAVTECSVFKDEFIEAQKRLTLEGNIVISVGLFGHSDDDEIWEGMLEDTLTETKKMLADMHKRKIDMSDEFFVINVGGYIGSSTRSEIEYVKATGKMV